MTRRVLNSSLEPIKNYHLWLIVFMFAIGIFMHYPQQLLAFNSPSLFSFLGLTRHAAERAYMLLPVAYASFFLGDKAGLASLIVAFSIMMPRSLLISQYAPDALLETVIVTVIGGLINIFFFIRRRGITKLKTAEDKLQLAYNEIEQILKTVAVGIRVMDTDYNILQCNEAFSRLTNLPREKIIGHKCYDVFSHGLCHTNRCLLKRILNGEEHVESEVVKDTLGGGQLHAICTATPYRRPDGKLLGMVESTNDITNLKKAEESLHYYLREITSAQEEERKRISRELHDSTAQKLIALIRQLDNYLNERVELSEKDAGPLRNFYGQLKEISQELRRFSRDLRPSVLDELGLIPALEWITSDLKNEYGLEINLEVIGDKKKLSNESELLLFRIVQEALRNTIKHADASSANVKVEFLENKIVITVSDDGAGFKVPDKFEDLPKTGKLGLAGIQERVKLLGGKLKIQSEPGSGTKLFIETPA